MQLRLVALVGVLGLVAGVNLGVTVPGHQPGELAVARHDYRRWFTRMDAYGIGVIRVYTVQAPRFYRELRRHNLAHPEAPIGVFHGVWVPEDPLLKTRDLYAPQTTAEFAGQIKAAVRAVHGNTVIAPRPGHASGRYTADISPWLLGWLIGVEWDPEIVVATDRTNADASAYRGRWFRAHTDATPTESWLARMLDHTAEAQQSQGRQVPVSFVNWTTTDPLTHPNEPNELEDLVGIDANHIAPTRRWTGGYFASYHAYPYYPDFLRYEPGLRSAGHKRDPYAGYVRTLRRHHAGIPVVVAEFGVPSGPGIAHRGPLGRDQGDHSEQELPGERRAKWFDAWTSESQFGLLASVPGAQQPPITVDGDDREWQRSSATVVHRGPGDVREVLATSDEGYLYLLVRVADRDVWRRRGVTVGFDVLPGGARLPGGPGRYRTADTALQIGPKRRAKHIDIGELRHGPSAPDATRFDARNMWVAAGRTIEVRVPWAGVGLADPSSRRALRVDADGSQHDVASAGVDMAVLADGELQQLGTYAWPTWEQPTWHERPKRGISAFTAALADVTRPRRRTSTSRALLATRARAGPLDGRQARRVLRPPTPHRPRTRPCHVHLSSRTTTSSAIS